MKKINITLNHTDMVKPDINFLHQLRDSSDNFINLMGYKVKQFKEHPDISVEILVTI